MNFVNLTPHAITILDESRQVWRVIQPSGIVARVKTTRAGAFPFYRTEFGEVEGVPEQQPDTILIVSALVRAYPPIAQRDDVYSPGELVRDAAGQPIGCIGLTK